MDRIIQKFLASISSNLNGIEFLFSPNPENSAPEMLAAISSILDGVEMLDATGAFSGDIEAGRLAVQNQDIPAGRDAVESALSKLSL